MMDIQGKEYSPVEWEQRALKVLGSFDPTFFRIHLCFSQDELDGFFAGSVSGPFYYVGSTLFHEWVHYLQAVGSSFGRYISHERVMESGFLSQAIEILIGDPLTRRNLKVPLVHILDKDVSERSDAESQALEALAWAALASNCSWAFFKNSNSKVPQVDRCAYGIKIPLTERFPIVKTDEGNIALGPLHMMEGQAFCEEAMYLLDLFRNSRRPLESWAAEIHARNILDPYTIAWRMVCRRLDLRPPHDLRFTSVLCDLALNPTNLCNPKLNDNVESHLVLEHVNWKDVHPGWRFMKALSAAQDVGTRFDGDDPECYVEMIGNICDRLNWELPADCIGEADSELCKWHHLESHRLRKELPLALALPSYYHGDVARAIPMFLDRPTFRSADEPLTQVGKLAKLRGSEEFEFMQNLIGELLPLCRQLFSGTWPYCPVHLQRLGPKGECVVGCDYYRQVEESLDLNFSEIIDLYS